MFGAFSSRPSGSKYTRMPSPIISSPVSSSGDCIVGFLMAGIFFDSRWMASSVSICMCTAPDTMSCRLRTCSDVTLPSVHTRSMNRLTIFDTLLPTSSGSLSSKPSSPEWSLRALRDSITLFETLVSSSR